MIEIAVMALILNSCAAGTSATDAELSRLEVKSESIAVDTTDVNTATISSVPESGTVHATDLLCTLLCFTPGLTLIGTISPPSVNAQSLQASDITMNGSLVYVAYNTAGSVQAGGVDVIAITSGGIPSLKSSTTYADTEINKVFVDSSSAKMYLAGNTSANATGALLLRVGLDGAGLPTSTAETKSLRSADDPSIPAYTATSVLKSGNYVYAVTGINGGLSVLNAADLTEAAFTAIPSARDLAVGPASNLLVVSGQTSSVSAQVGSYAITTGVAQPSSSATSFAGSVIDDGKSSIYAASTGYVATGGQGGTKLVCYNGTSIGSMPLPNVTGMTSSDSAANAATFGNGIIYVAQGGAGVYMYAVGNALLNLNGCNGYTISYVGKFTLGGRQSANNVYYRNGYLVVATGSGGFQIIQVTQSLVAGLLSIL